MFFGVRLLLGRKWLWFGQFFFGTILFRNKFFFGTICLRYNFALNNSVYGQFSFGTGITNISSQEYLFPDSQSVWGKAGYVIQQLFLFLGTILLWTDSSLLELEFLLRAIFSGQIFLRTILLGTFLHETDLSQDNTFRVNNFRDNSF